MELVETSFGREDRLLVLLPEQPATAGAEAHWWQVRGDVVAASQVSAQWLEFSGQPVIGLAPTTALRIAFSEQAGDATERQRLTLARLAAISEAIAEPGTLHASATIIDTAESEARTLAALVANDAMLGWLDWAERLGARLDHIVPAAMVLPFGDTWVGAAVGNERMVGRLGTVIPDEPELTAALIDGAIEPMVPAQVEAALVRIARRPRPDLRSGTFARRRIIIDRSRWKLIASLVAATLTLAVLTALVQIVKLERSTARLEAETAALTQGPGPTQTAPVTATFARLLSIVSNQPGATVASLGANGPAITATVAAPAPAQVQTLIRSMERDGYRVVASQRTSTDGRALTDITIHGGR